MGAKKETVVVSVRLDSKVKTEMQEVCEELGLTMAGAFQMFAKAVARGRCIPLDLDLNRRPQVTYAAIDLEEKDG
ncbi:MAG: type II toxin-antitoxin system RelB/DinJ family antitoxin [Eggerthellaceae bacterium]|nr:type II toxin-antitoxin system RelB/DinJ family antitoxin [Eggerthellaceae bacterium]